MSPSWLMIMAETEERHDCSRTCPNCHVFSMWEKGNRTGISARTFRFRSNSSTASTQHVTCPDKIAKYRCVNAPLPPLRRTVPIFGAKETLVAIDNEWISAMIIVYVYAVRTHINRHICHISSDGNVSNNVCRDIAWSIGLEPRNGR
jgi:hypothetical protein